MMNKTTFFAFPLILTLFLSQCTMKKNSETTDSQPSTPAMFELVKDGECKYSVVYPEGANKAVVDNALLIKKELDKIVNVPVEFASDWTKNAEYDDSKLEILVGNTRHKQASEVRGGIGYSEYAVKVVGNKIVVTSWSPESLTIAVQRLVSQIRTGHKENHNGGSDILLPIDLDIKGSFSPIISSIPTYSGGTASGVINCGNGCYLLHIGNTDKNQFDAYLTVLSSQGYSLYAQNEIAGNLFNTHVSDKYTIHTSYTKFDKSVRVVIEPRATLPARESENQYTKLVESSITQIGLESPQANGSMSIGGESYVIQLADGSFIVIDGGFNRDIDADRIFSVMRDKAPNKNNIVIAAWFLSHAHGDHAGALLKFTDKYSSMVKVSTFVLNFPSTSETLAQGFDAEKPVIDLVFAAMGKYSGAKVIKAHTGQKFHLKNAVVEMLYTLDSNRPNEFTDFNMTSLVFSLKIEGQRIMFLNDAHTVTCNLLVNMYGDHLKSDFVQLAHHGSFNAATPQLYDKIRPAVVLWPAGTNTYKSVKNRPENVHLMSLGTVKEVHLAANDIITIALPWSPKN